MFLKEEHNITRENDNQSRENTSGREGEIAPISCRPDLQFASRHGNDRTLLLWDTVAATKAVLRGSGTIGQSKQRHREGGSLLTWAVPPKNSQAPSSSPARVA